MGFVGDVLKEVLSNISASQHQRNTYEPPKRYTPEEYVIYEQEQSGERWHNVPLCELSRLAQTTYRGKYVKVDKYGFLVFCYSSNSRKTSQSVQCELDENGQLKMMPHGYYPGQWRDSADEFVEKVNQQISFR